MRPACKELVPAEVLNTHALQWHGLAYSMLLVRILVMLSSPKIGQRTLPLRSKCLDRKHELRYPVLQLWGKITERQTRYIIR